MLTKAFQHLLGPLRGSRFYSVTTTREVLPTAGQQPATKLVRYPYYVPRNTQGSLPVYSDIRNNGTRIQVLIRNVEGNVEVRAVPRLLLHRVLLMTFPLARASSISILSQALAKDLTEAFASRPDAQRMKVLVKPRQLVLQGGYWKTDIMQWLVQRGF